MPVYLFPYHAYGTWYPDRPQGFVQEEKGIQPTNTNLAVAYKQAAKHRPYQFEPTTQRALIEKLHHIAETDSLHVYGVSTDPTHLHVLIGWNEGVPTAKFVAVSRICCRYTCRVYLERPAGHGL